MNASEQMTQGMSKASAGQDGHPHRGDHFRCDKCGMQVEVKTDCGCHDNPQHFFCCGQPMNKV